jgi:antitoxin (DNA-binding transcriptional repressor) of toxin-antitoxin stability system
VITVSVQDAKTHFPSLIEGVVAGDDVVIARDGQPVVRMVRVDNAEPLPKKPLLGSMKGRVADIGGEAMAPLPDEYLGLDLRSDKPL